LRTAAVVVPAVAFYCSVVYAFRTPLIQATVGARYVDHAQLVALFAAYYILFALGNILLGVAIALGFARLRFGASLVAALGCVVAEAALLPTIGIAASPVALIVGAVGLDVVLLGGALYPSVRRGIEARVGAKPRPRLAADDLR
jgi:hypothetical protein